MAEISVVVPVYKVEQYLERCIDSILSQTFDDFKLILVDDGSPDKCPQICDEYQLKDSRVKVIHRKNGGLSAARNSGISWVLNNNLTEWITFIDSDDWIHPQYLELLLTSAQIAKTDVTVAAFSIIDAYSEKFEKIVTNKFQVLNTEDFFTNTQLHPISACGRLFKTHFFKKVQFPEGKIHEDRFTTYKILFQCDNITYVEYELYYCYENEHSITRAEWSPKRLDDILALEEQLKYFKKTEYRRSYSFIMHEYASLLLYSIKKISKSKKYFFRRFVLKMKILKLCLFHKKHIKFTQKEKTEVFKYVFPIIYRVKRKLYE